MTGGEPKQTFVCNFSSCKQSFDSRQKLANHKATSKNHPYCLHCDRNFTNADSARDHISQMHPAAQELHCPGCNQRFGKFSGLIGHWENNECPNQKFSATSIHENREKSLTFAHRLRQQGLGDNSKVGVISCPNDGPLVPKQQDKLIPASFWGEVDANPIFFKPGEFPLPGIQQFRHGDSKTPDLLTGFDDMSLNDTAPSAWPSSCGNSQKSGEALFPDAPDPVKPDPNMVEQQFAPNPNDPRGWSDHDPANPAFNVGKYWNECLGWFKCPYGCGGKKHRYATGARLITHLQSPAHRDTKKIRCPKCIRQFASAQALAQHAESATTRCSINTTDQYNYFVGELSAGFVQPAGHHLDSTTRYKITKKSETEEGSVGNVTQAAGGAYDAAIRRQAMVKPKGDAGCGW